MCEKAQAATISASSEQSPVGEAGLIEDVEVSAAGLQALRSRRLRTGETAFGLGFSFCLHAAVPVLALLLSFLFTPPSIPPPQFVTVSLVSMAGRGGGHGDSAGKSSRPVPSASHGSAAAGPPVKASPPPAPVAETTHSQTKAAVEVESAHIAKPAGHSRERRAAVSPKSRRRAVKPRKHADKRPVKPAAHREDAPTARPDRPLPARSAAGLDPTGGSNGGRDSGGSLSPPGAAGRGPGAGGGLGGGLGSGSGGGPGELDLRQVDTPPVPVSKVEPEFPEAAREMGVSGRVLLRFLVKTDGSVSKESVVEARPPGVFNRSALKAIAKWKFKPGRYKGKVVATWVELPVRFRLAR